MAVVGLAQIRPDRNPGVTKLLGRMSAKQAAIAIANWVVSRRHVPGAPVRVKKAGSRR